MHFKYTMNATLRWAANNGHIDIVKYLVEQGADIHDIDNIALHYAVENGHTDVVKYLKGVSYNV